MNLRQKLIEALRSGKYQQGYDMLRDGDCFCPIGIVADIIDPNGWIHSPSIFRSGCVWLWRGCTCINMSVYDLGQDACLLIKMNDSRKYSFSQLADWLESRSQKDSK